MSDESGSVPAVIDEEDNSINEICSVKEKYNNTHSRVATVGMGTNAMRSFMPMLVMASMMLEPTPYGIPSNPYDGAGRRMREPLRERKCVLSECDIHFTPIKSSETCCSKEHFFILRDNQKKERKKNVN